MSDKRGRRVFLRLLSETFFVSDEAVDPQKIGRLVKKLDRLDPAPASAPSASAEESLRRWYQAQGVDPPPARVPARRPRHISRAPKWLTALRCSRTWRTCVAPICIVLSLFMIIWIPASWQQTKRNDMAPSRMTGEGYAGSAPSSSAEQLDMAQAPDSGQAAEQYKDKDEAPREAGSEIGNEVLLRNSIDTALPAQEWLSRKMEAGEPLAVTGTVEKADACEDGRMGFLLETPQGYMGFLLTSALFDPSDILGKRICVWVREDAYTWPEDSEDPSLQTAAMAKNSVEIQESDGAGGNLAVFVVEDAGALQEVYVDGSLNGLFPQTIDSWNAQVDGE